MSKQEVLDHILLAWQANPKLRLGQLLVSAMGVSECADTVFYALDEDLAKAMLEYNVVGAQKLEDAKVVSIEERSRTSHAAMMPSGR